MGPTEFTPLASLLGGVMIGVAAVVLMWATGRVAGVSGFVSRMLPPYTDDQFAVRLAFVAGLFVAPFVYRAISGAGVSHSVTAHSWLLIAGGLLVGFGSVVGSGCTSGHGVCGIARLSPRSLTATAVFMATAVMTVFLTRHVFAV